MAIGSMLQSGIQGLQLAQMSMERSAGAIAHASTDSKLGHIAVPNPVALAPSRAETVTAPSVSHDRALENFSVRQESLEDALVNLQVQAYQAAGSARVVKTADQLLGTLINTRA